jgi:predicted Zn-dependent protease
MTTHRRETLSAQIEQLVRAHIEATRREAAQALERAFLTTTTTARAAAAPQKPSRKSSGRRTREELLALRERLYEVVCAQPGETMMVLAPSMGATAVELERPMSALRRAGRVRSVGQRHLMRYYPTVSGSKS